jgi:hypothetical protein
MIVLVWFHNVKEFSSVSSSWVFRELLRAELGDERLNKRLIRIVEALSEQPEGAIPQACGKAGAKGAYRFFDNDRVRAEDILAAHATRTVERATDCEVVLAPQDTMTWSLNEHHATRGLGPIGSDRKSRGMLVHSTMFVSPTGVPLGLVDQQVWARSLKKYGSRTKARQKPVEQKESNCWLKSMAAVQEVLPADRKVVVIGDRESDIFDLFAAPRRAGVELLVRVGRPTRRVDHEAKYLNEALAQSPVRGIVRVEVPRADGRPARTAELELRWCTLTVHPPRNHFERSKLAPLPLQFILAQERRPPAGQKRICWLLATTLPIDNLDQAARVLTWYTYRWRIERFHFVLKSGCRIEDLQLETAERLQRALPCFSLIAWRLLWLTYAARENPDASCAQILERCEWESLHAKLHPKKPIPRTPPTMREANRMIAQLGGFLARKGDGEPGVQTLWRGWRRLQDISEAWHLATTHVPRQPAIARSG